MHAFDIADAADSLHTIFYLAVSHYITVHDRVWRIFGVQ